MSIEAAIAQITAAIERREDEIVALREVMAMLQNDRGVAVATPEPPPKPIPPPPKPAPAERRQTEPGLMKLRGRAANNVARQLNGHSLSLSPRLASMFDALIDGPVSRQHANTLLGEGASRSKSLEKLKQKLAAGGYCIAWNKAQDGYVLTEGKS